MIDVIWYDQCFGNWDHGIFEYVFSEHKEIFRQHNTKELYYTDRAIIFVSGKPDVDPLRKYLETFRSGVVILISEEDGYFDFKTAIPSHLEVWTTYFTESKRDIKTRLLIGAPNRLKDYKINKHLPKKYKWSFIGQSQNPFRQEAVSVMKKMKDGFLHVAKSFGGIKGGIEYQEYLDICCQSEFVICPAGSMCVDSFRLYEAMECGAIPITDKRAPRDDPEFNYWQEVYPRNNLLLVDDWKELPEFIKYAKSEHYSNDWWGIYKRNLEQKLIIVASD